MHEFLSRCRPFFTDRGLEILSQKTIAISGLGGVGGGAFLALVRCGCASFRLAENGIFDPPDMNRQAAAFGSTMDRPKLEVYVELARSINPDIEIQTWPKGLQIENLEEFIQGADVHIGAMDVEKGAEVKERTPEVQKRFKVPMFTAGVVGFGALMINYHHEGMREIEFNRLVRIKSEAKPGLPSLVTRCFDAQTMEVFERAWSQGQCPSTAVGGLLSNALLANEVMVYLLQGTGVVGREAVFAPRFVTLDALGLDMRVIDVSSD
ncbi:MAG: thiamine biosynthesis protein ThiF [Deltaproteobacteria bacterium]|nr:thiamine biosynthesis protein ThiF [Deltaproteobacteria bacterium]